VTGATPHGWREQPRPFDFYDLTGAIERLGEHFHWPVLRFEPAKVSFFDEDISFRIMEDKQPVGVIGKVSAAVLSELDIKQPVYLAELEVERLLSISQSVTEFVPLPLYPAAPRDLAIIVSQEVCAGDLVNTIKETAGKPAESVQIFDLYAGKQIEEGKKSIAVSITYRSDAGSLSTEEVDTLQQKVIEMLKRKFGAEIRDR
jgi:phenylalanyl-tRNA synthetase beta chain